MNTSGTLEQTILSQIGDVDMVKSGDGSTWLFRDMTVSCDTDIHKVFRRIDALAILVFPFGVHRAVLIYNRSTLQWSD